MLRRFPMSSGGFRGEAFEVFRRFSKYSGAIRIVQKGFEGFRMFPRGS